MRRVSLDRRSQVITIPRRDYHTVGAAPEAMPVRYYHPLDYEQGETTGLGLFIIDDLIIAISAVASAIASAAAFIAQIVATISAIVSAVVAKITMLITAIMNAVGLGSLWEGVIEIYNLGAGWINTVNQYLVGAVDSMTGGLLSNMTTLIQMPSIPGLNVPGFDRLNFMDGVRFAGKVFDVPLDPASLLAHFERDLISQTPLGQSVLSAGDFVGSVSDYDTLGDALDAKAQSAASGAIATGFNEATGLPITAPGDIANAAAAFADPGAAITKVAQSSAAVAQALDTLTFPPALSLPALSLPSLLPGLPGISFSVSDISNTPAPISKVEQAVAKIEAQGGGAIASAKGVLSDAVGKLTLEDVLAFLMPFLSPGETFQTLPPARRDMLLAQMKAKFPGWTIPTFDWAALDALRSGSNIVPVVIVGSAVLAGAYIILAGKKRRA